MSDPEAQDPAWELETLPRISHPISGVTLEEDIAAAAADELDTCWHRIGVYGDRTCSQIPQDIHCRNCPVYSSAALRLLNRPVPEDYRRERTTHFANPETGKLAARTSAILFRISNEWLALPTQAFQEVAEWRLVHSLPHRRHGIVLGLVNIRGELLICISLARLLGLEPSQRSVDAPSRLMVATCDSDRVVFPVDEVHGIYRFQPQEIKPPPATVAKFDGCFTQGMLVWRDHAVGLLDAPHLFSALNRRLT